MPGEGRTGNWSGSAMAVPTAMIAAATLAVLVAAAALPAAAEPLLSAPESDAPLPSPAPSPPVAPPVQAVAPAVEPVTVQVPAKPQTDAFDCWLLDPDRLEKAADQGLCGDAFARAPEIAALPDAPPLPALTPPRKPKAPDRRIRASNRGSSHSETHAMGTSAARVSRTGGGGEGGDFFSNFQRDFRALTDLIGGGSSPRRGDGGPGSHTSHRN